MLGVHNGSTYYGEVTVEGNLKSGVGLKGALVEVKGLTTPSVKGTVTNETKVMNVQ